MRHSISKDLYAYWDRLRGARAAPDRNDIDPAAIRHLLADCFIVEIDQACLLPLRLSGTRLNALWGGEGRGAPFLGMWREADQRELAAAVLTVIDGATPIVGGVKARARAADSEEADPSRRALDLELLLLPLRHFGKTRSRVLGSLSPLGEVDWFGRVPAAKIEIVSLRTMNAREREGFGARPERPPFPPVEIGGRRFIVYEGGKARA
ncbi:PAS domain-containing protein [Methylocystis bryophila]|uniref:PAS domain-containing protein n=1 Tax=Methylocystis bryophila TaxID=655015 RepID=A0A1W6MZ18_9HYPH|nr:PAS domain-containing protein [Methylocystis bryophila]ARN82789.1 hypothetical protein B1812_18735 [Methylocystis bryophila]BDV39034.1 hypothetical protein DSM21852_22870 [Methylocystis bryophila]